MNVAIRKFGGQASSKDPADLWFKGGSRAQKNTCLITRDWQADSMINGTGLAVRTFTNTVVSSYEWKAPDGVTYLVAHCMSSDTGSIGYFAYPSTTEVPLSISNAIPKQIEADFIEWNGYLYVPLGAAGVYRVQANNGVLTATLEENVPPTSQMLIDDSRMYLALNDESEIIWSALGVPRFRATSDEIDANTYGLSFGIKLQDFGIAGNIIGCKKFNQAKVWWTQSDCFIIWGNGLVGETTAAKIGNGYGLGGKKCFGIKNDVLYWHSKHKGGAYLAMTFGRAVEGATLLETVNAKQHQVSIFDAGDRISDVLQTIPNMTYEQAAIGWNSKQGWEDLPAANRVAMDTTTESNIIQLGILNIATTFSSYCQYYGYWNCWNGTYFDNLGFSAGHEQIYSQDGNVSTYMEFVANLVAGSMYHRQRCDCKIWLAIIGGTFIEIRDVVTTAADVWTDYKFTPVTNVGGIKIEWTLRGSKPNPTDDHAQMVVEFTYSFAPQIVGKIRLLGATWSAEDAVSGGDASLRIYEVEVYGGGGSGGSLFTEYPLAGTKAEITGLTISSNIDLGAFTSRSIGTGHDGTGGITVAIRAGNIPLASIESGTGGVVAGNILHDHGHSSFLTKVQVGDYALISDVKYTICAITEDTLTFTTAPAAGSGITYYVYGVTNTSTVWSAWKTLTQAEMDTGVLLKNLKIRNDGTTAIPGADANGKFYVQARADFILSSFGTSPRLKSFLFTFPKGKNLTSIMPWGEKDFYHYFSSRLLTADTLPGQEIVTNDYGEHSVITGKKITAYFKDVTGVSRAIANKKVCEQFGGMINYVSSANVPLNNEWKGGVINGHEIYPDRIKAGLAEYSYVNGIFE